ncbi:MAG: hypothetical protein IJR49_05040 [Treponema sp.]|nr:hypothetical protein [Treponema sp.]
MKVQAEALINRFLRTHKECFSIKEFSRILLKMGIRANKNECFEYLAMNPFVFSLPKNMFVTRCGVFTDKLFSFKPTRKEVEQGIFVAGSRCMPFADPEMFPSMFTFIYKGNVLSQQSAEFDAGTAADLHALYGVEFASQYITADPANTGLDLASNDFELPPYVKLTGKSLLPLINDCAFKYGDRLLCKILNWDLGQIEIVSVVQNKKSLQLGYENLKRESWNACLENALLESFDIVGPRSSIEEQLALVFLEKQEELCTNDCGSIEEFLETSDSVSYAPFGVETRLWKTDEEVPAVGKWNEIPEEDDIAEEILSNLAFPDFIIDAAVLTQMFNKKYDAQKVLAQILPEASEISLAEKRLFILHINSRHDILKKNYNWFADFPISKIRERALALYSQTNSLIFEIDHAATNLERYPQQALIILSQIFSHIIRILEMLVNDSTNALNDQDEIILSIEGMEMNFEGIRDELVDMVEQEKKLGFSVTK